MGRTRRKKKHTERQKVAGGNEEQKVPKTFVVERGKVGHILHQLVQDLRQVMEPHTATKLKAQHRNVLKDFVMVAGPLGVTHLLLLSRSSEYVNLKVCKLPRGPTITFHVKSFCLAKEVLSSLKKPAVNSTQFLTPPMLALNNFNSKDIADHLLTTVFQNMFPPINIHSVNLSSIRRCLLLHFDPDSNLIYLRHYGIRAVARGLSRGVKKLASTHPPNLGQLSDISEYLLCSGYGSESEGEELGGEGEVTLPQDLPGRGNLKAEQSVVRLNELGPRLALQLVKIEAGLCGGEVLHHAFVQKSGKEVRKLRLAKHRERRLKEKRKKEQEANVTRKNQEKEHHRNKSLAGMGKLGDDEGEEENEDVEWYRKEVGEDPDPDTFAGMKSEVEYKRKNFLGKRVKSSGSSSSKSKMVKSDSTSKLAGPRAGRSKVKGRMQTKNKTLSSKGFRKSKSN